MKTLLSLTMVLAFFVAIPQCFGQDADQSPAQLFTEQQPLQMSLLVMAPPTIVAVPPSCHQTVCRPTVKDFLAMNACDKGDKQCRADRNNFAKECRIECTIECHATEDRDECDIESSACTLFADRGEGEDGFFKCTAD